MSNETSLEQRLETLEREVAEIKLHLPPLHTNGSWVDAISGSMREFPEFDEVVRLGREYRQSSTSPTNENE